MDGLRCYLKEMANNSSLLHALRAMDFGKHYSSATGKKVGKAP
jgi:hypothetical protein